MYAETRRTLELEARWYIGEARYIRINANTPTIESLNEKTVKAFLSSLTPLDIINVECKDFLVLAIGGLTRDAQGVDDASSKAKE